MTEETSIYVPRPNSIPWKLLTFLLEQPDRIISRMEVADRFGLTPSAIDSTLAAPLNKEAIRKCYDDKGYKAFQLGLVKNFRLDAYVAPPPEAFQPSAPTPAAGSKWSAITSASTAAPAAPTAPVKRAPVIAAAGAVPATEPEVGNRTSSGGRVEHHPHSSIHAGCETVEGVSTTSTWPPQNTVSAGAGPAQPLTPAQIHALQIDPRTACDSRAEFHQHFGWLTLAMDVLAGHAATAKETA